MNCIVYCFDECALGCIQCVAVAATHRWHFFLKSNFVLDFQPKLRLIDRTSVRFRDTEMKWMWAQTKENDWSLFASKSDEKQEAKNAQEWKSRKSLLIVVRMIFSPFQNSYTPNMGYLSNVNEICIRDDGKTCLSNEY